MNPDAPITDDEIRALFAPLLGAPVALAVSGGVDSRALMLIAQRWLELEPSARPTSAPDRPPLIVLTVDHGLRAGSADDAAWVVSQAKAVGLPCRLLRWNGEKPKQGIQAEARVARYRLMHEALVEEARPYAGVLRPLLTAHHMEDQAETFLMRLGRGSGIDGLSAMRVHEELAPAEVDKPALRLHRPLLHLPKSRLVATLKAADLEWREDPSNEREDFERVRVRKVLAALSELGMSSEAIARSTARLSRARSAVMHQAREAIDRWVDWHDGQFGSLSMDALNDLPEEIAIRVLKHLIVAYGGDAPDARLSEVEALTERIRATSERAWPARAATLGGCRLDWRPGGDLRVWREAGRTALPTIKLEPGATSVVWDRRFEISASRELSGPADVRPLDLPTWRSLRMELPNLGKLRPPPGAVATLPSCWIADQLVAVAGLPAPSSPLIRAEFIGGRDHTAL